MRSRPAGRIQDFGARDFENKQRSAVYHPCGLSGTKRERLISKGFLHCDMVHEFIENRTRMPLKSLAIPAGFEPATHGVEIRYSRVIWDLQL
jgi:hypothetical protein